MPWLGRAHTSPAGKRGFGKLHVAAIGRNPPLWGSGSYRDSAKPICSFAELFTKMKGLGVVGLRFLMGSHFKNLLNFLALHLRSLASVQGCSQSHPVGCCSQHQILWSRLLQPRIPYPVLFLLLWFKNQLWHGDWWEGTLWFESCFSRYMGPKRTFRRNFKLSFLENPILMDFICTNYTT